MRFSRAAVATVLLLLAACGPPGPDRSTVLSAEDARASTPQQLQILLNAAGNPDASLRAQAVRALGRLERPSLVDSIAQHLDDPDPVVRAHSADALAQSVFGSDGSRVLDTLAGRAEVEQDPWVRGVLARSLGRLHLGRVGLGRVENTFAQLGRISSTLLSLSHAFDGGPLPDSALVQVALGIESFVRLNVDKLPANGAMKDRLRDLLGTGLDRTDAGRDAMHVRALATMALGEAGALDAESMRRALDDPAPDVRADAARFLGTLPEPDRRKLVGRALADASPHVRFAAVRSLIPQPRTSSSCSTLEAAATGDTAWSVKFIALAGLQQPCPDRSAQRTLLRRVAGSFDPAGARDWHEPAIALVGLAHIAPASARTLLPRFLTSPDPFVRAWAAQAAGALGRVPTLDSLAADSSDNVRTAAIQELVRLRGHDADSVLLAQTSRDDPQLLLTAADLLKGSPRGVEVAREALSAFERISRARRETYRDPRRALLARVGELGDSSLAPRLDPYLRDYDPRVARDVADILSRWTEHTVEAHPEPLPPPTLPTSAQLDSIERTTVLLHMRRGGTIAVRLFPNAAPTNAFRFARQAREGYFDGLTFHRVIPNYIIQGGSPSANEYQGSPRYSRDEVGLLVHWRGRVGLSTRGRDTGDGQIFINLGDNVSFDHQYTVWGEVVSGMDVADAVQEGDVIERAEVRAEG